LRALRLTILVLSVCCFALLLSGESPWHVFLALLHGAVGTKADVARTLGGATPLIFTGLAVAIPFRAGLFNIGAEGQLIVAGFTAGVLATFNVPLFLLPVLVFAAAMAAGALWGGVAGVFRAKLGVHEVIGTILMNFIAVYLVAWLLREIGLAGMEPKTENVPEAVRLPEIFPGSGAGLGLAIAIAIAIAADFLLFRTRAGLLLRAWGGNPSAATAAGARGVRIVVVSMVIGGGCAALAGVTQVLGVHGAYVEGFSPGYGFTGIAVALLAANRPAGVILAALLFAGLRSGAFAMDALAGIPRESVGILEVLVIVLVASERFRAGKGGA
jgi:simple sugar transport system permease protein